MVADDEVELPIEPAQIMMFARAVGDERWADSLDFGDPAGTLAPPTFTQTLQHFIPDYRMRPTARRPWIGSGATPTGAPSAPDTANVLHAEQHFEYHKPVRAGTILRASMRPGARWSKDGRAGRLNFSEEIIEFREPDGSLAVTSRLVEVQVVAREDRTADD